MATTEFQFDPYYSQQENVFSFQDRVSFRKHSVASRHSRSMSAPVYQPSSCWDLFQSKEDFKPDKTKRWSCMLKDDVDRRISLDRASLEKDVQELQTQLQIEKTVRRALEKALNSPCEPTFLLEPCGLSPQTEGLIKEIASLELEVFHLEQHVLSLYRKVFDNKGRNSSAQKQLVPTEHSVTQHRSGKAYSFQHRRHVSASSHGCHSSQANVSCTQVKTRHASLLGGKFSIDEDSSTLANVIIQESQQEYQHQRGWPSMCDVQKPLREATPPSKPRNTYAVRENFYSCPNKLSEQMVRCMAAIYCKLADPPLPFIGSPLSPPFSTSTSSTTSRDVSSDGWSPQWKDPLSGSAEGQSAMIEVPWIRVDKERLTYAAHALRNFRSMVEQLEQVHPGEMKHDEKLAFWINVYNALVMHAYLAYGIPRSNLKRVSLLQKAAYKVGPYSINAYTIEHSILGCRTQRPAQWLQTLFGPLTKFKTEERRAYALNTPEPLVCFGLCSGGRSDPAIRVYTPKSVNSELEAAKKDFLQVKIITKNNKVLVPRILETYARDSGLSTNKLLDWITQNVSEKQSKLIKSCCSRGKNRQQLQQQQHQLEWIPHDYNFRYIFVRELSR